MEPAQPVPVGVRHHRDLEVWKLADEVRRQIIQLVARADVRRDHPFCDQASRAASSACHNIAEGFYRFSPGEFSHFLNIAYGSLGELLDCADEARHKTYLSGDEFDSLDTLISRAMAAMRSLRRYLAAPKRPSR
jgi:four helix bundle protein